MNHAGNSLIAVAKVTSPADVPAELLSIPEEVLPQSTLVLGWERL